MKGLSFAVVQIGYTYNDPGWNTAMRYPASKTHPTVEISLAQVPISFVVINHPTEGYILYDVGDYPNMEDGIERPKFWQEYFPNDHKRENYVDKILPKHGIELSDISSIIISHMHYDHAAGLKFFGNTKAGKIFMFQRQTLQNQH